MKEFIITDKKFCACGCETECKRRFISGHNTRLRQKEKSPAWKGGKIIFRGYIMVRCENHPRAWLHGHYVYEHILIMEKIIGRYLTLHEVVHHVNHDRSDNRIENLLLMTKSKHSSLHSKERGLKIKTI